jgi:Flp pilus assembly protein TadG
MRPQRCARSSRDCPFVHPAERTQAVKLQSGRHRAEGQIIVIAAGALVLIVVMVGLVIDGGTLYAQQRVAQNGADAVSTAGTLVIAENLGSATDIRTQHDVYVAINSIAAKNGLAGLTAVYTDDTGLPIGVDVTDAAQPIPATARGVRAGGSRNVNSTFSRVLGFGQFTATAQATVVAGKASGECVIDQDGCTLLPVTFPLQTFECDKNGNQVDGTGTWVGAPPPGANPTDPYWPLVGAESLPTVANPTGDTSKMAILPLCKSATNASGAFGWLDLDPNIPNLPGEIVGPLTVSVDIPGWFQTQAGNPNSVGSELSAYIHKPVLIPLNNGACRVDPGVATTCPLGQAGKDPTGNNTWYYVPALGTFYIDQVLVQGSNVAQCASPPGHPLVPVTNGAGFLGCLKGWFLNYVTSGPIVPGEQIIRGQTSIAIQLIK